MTMNNNDEWVRSILTKIDSRQDDQAETLAKLTVSVIEHVRRTDLLEQDVKPIKRHVEFVNTLAKSVIVLVGLAATLQSLGAF